jgi:methylglutamate dehydrogenase subunit D
MVERLSALASAFRPGDFGAAHPAGPGLAIAERRSLAMVQVAAFGGSEGAVRAALAAALDLAPAAEANRAVEKDGVTILWVGPGRWLIVETERSGRTRGHQLSQSLSGTAAVTDLGHSRVVLRVAGPRARDLLGKGSSVDFHPRAFPVGACAQSLLGHVGALIHAVDERPSFDVYIARSYALTVWEWIGESASEWGFRVEVLQ